LETGRFVWSRLFSYFFDCKQGRL